MSEGETQRTEEEPKLDELKVPGLNVYISFCCHVMFEFYVKPQIPDINSHFPKLAQKLQLHSCYLLLQKSSWIQRNYNADKYSYFPTYLGLASSKEILFSCQICSVQFSRSVVPDSSRAHELQHTRPPCPSPTLGSPPRLLSIESVMPSNHLIFCRPLLLLPSIFPSIRVFSNESALRIR